MLSSYIKNGSQYCLNICFYLYCSYEKLNYWFKNI